MPFTDLEMKRVEARQLDITISFVFPWKMCKTFLGQKSRMILQNFGGNYCGRFWLKVDLKSKSTQLFVGAFVALDMGSVP